MELMFTQPKLATLPSEKPFIFQFGLAYPKLLRVLILGTNAKIITGRGHSHMKVITRVALVCLMLANY